MKHNLPGQLHPALARLVHFQDDFERQIEQEMMASERLRSRFLASAFLAMAVILVGAGALFPDLLRRLFNSQFNMALALVVLAGYATYEFLFFFGVGQFLKRGLKFPIGPKYANALIETSFPTVVLILLLPIFPAEVCLGLPPVFVYFLFIILSALRLEPVLSFFTGLFAALGYLALAMLSVPTGLWSSAAEWWTYAAPWLSKGLILLIAGGMAAFVASQIRGRLVGVIKSREERNLIAGIFGQHVSPSVMERLIHQETALDSETREVCVLFLDIRDFTRFSHERGPDEVVAYLNRLFDFMIEIVNANHGVINKFLGDGFMAIYGAPLEDGEASLNAVRSALEISDRLAAKLVAGQLPPTSIGIGIHYGKAVTGSVGSAVRKEYTVIGDVVNLASRIEQLNKEYQSEILLSREAWQAAQASMTAGSPAMAATELGAKAVKGRATPVEIIRLR